MRAHETCVLMIIYCLTYIYLSMHVACFVYCCILPVNIGQTGPGVASGLYTNAYFVMHLQWADTQFLCPHHYSQLTQLRVCVSARNSNFCKVLRTRRGNFLRKGLQLFIKYLAIQLFPRHAVCYVF